MTSFESELFNNINNDDDDDDFSEICTFISFVSVSLVRHAIDYHITMSSVAVSFISSAIVFALIYVVCLRLNASTCSYAYNV